MPTSQDITGHLFVLAYVRWGMGVKPLKHCASLCGSGTADAWMVAIVEQWAPAGC